MGDDDDGDENLGGGEDGDSGKEDVGSDDDAGEEGVDGDDDGEEDEGGDDDGEEEDVSDDDDSSDADNETNEIDIAQLQSEFDELLLPYTEDSDVCEEDIDEELADAQDRIAKLRNKDRHKTPEGIALRQKVNDFEHLVQLRHHMVGRHALHFTFYASLLTLA